MRAQRREKRSYFNEFIHKLINPEAVAVYPEGIQIITNAVRWAVPVSRTDELVCLGVTDTAGSRE